MMKKTSEIVRITAFFLILVLLPILVLALPVKTFSPEENRDLATAPVLRADTLADRTFMNGVEDYLADHFPARTDWVSAKGAMQLALGAKEVGGVFLTEDRMVQKQTAVNERMFQGNLDTIRDFAQAFNITPTVLVVPDAASRMTNLLPAGAGISDDKAPFAQLSDALCDSCRLADYTKGITIENLNDLYYRTDHHWTAAGAYVAYCLLGDSLGYTPYPIRDFEIELGEHEFWGSLYSKCLMKNTIEADRVELWQYKGGSALCVKDEKETVLSDSVFFRQYLAEKDQYLTFLGPNRGVTVIENPDAAGKGTLFVIKDSYANSLAPFLALHYEKTVLIDPRYYRGDVQSLTEQNPPTDVLFCFGRESFFTQNNLSKLLF